MNRLFVLASLLAVLAVAPAPAAAQVQVNTVLSGANSVPANASTGFARSSVTLDVSTGILSASVALDQATSATSATIREGSAGSNGPVLITLTGGPFVWLGSSAPLTQPQISAFLHEGLYAETISSTFPAGELRGQLRIDLHHQAFLSGDAVNPPVVTAASGFAQLRIRQPQGNVFYSVETTGLGTSFAAHIHDGPVGVLGPVLEILNGGSGTWSGSTGPMTDDRLLAFLSGDTYINVHTLQEASGELRGQIRSGGLNVDTDTISTVNGGVQLFHLETKPSFSNDLFLLLGSTAGSSPGFTFMGASIPLNVPNAYFLTTLRDPMASPLIGSVGLPDNQGQIFATLTVPPLVPALAGVVGTHAFVGLAFQPLRVTYVSNPVTLELLP